MVKRVVFIRAAETDWNRLGRWQGWVAAPINAHGRRQAEKLARFIRNLGLSALYSSDLVRARQTAEVLVEALGFPAVYDARLRERGVGHWQGLTLDEMRAWYPAECEQLQADPEHCRVEGIESRAEVRARMEAALADYLRRDAGETIGVLSHTTSIKLLLDLLLPGAGMLTQEFGNTSVTTVVLTDDEWEIVVAQDVSHLEGMESQALPEVERPLMILVIDNYDSFTYNLVQYFGELGAELCVVRNDQMTLRDVEALNPSHIVISPGPGTPDDSGVSLEVLRELGPTRPVLGVCLGHQAIGQVFGGVVKRAPKLMHGKTSLIYHHGTGVFSGLPTPFEATRYHSLIVEEATLPATLEVTARTIDGEIMGLRHRAYPVHGVQFHPESILTAHGKVLLQNFLEMSVTEVA